MAYAASHRAQTAKYAYPHDSLRLCGENSLNCILQKLILVQQKSSHSTTCHVFLLSYLSLSVTLGVSLLAVWWHTQESVTAVFEGENKYI